MLANPVTYRELPLPSFYEAQRVDQVWKVPYQERARQAEEWIRQYDIRPAYQDQKRLALVAVDVQNTFCIPDFELYVGGRSGSGAVDDNRRLIDFIYRNLGCITEITATMDTHQAIQIFHPVFLIDKHGRHPAPFTQISVMDIEQGRWKFNPAAAGSLGIPPEYGQAHLLHYTHALKRQGKYDLTIWPYHAMLGGIGHALVSAFEEALFFHSIARNTQIDVMLKGGYALTENYSAIGPEVEKGPDGKTVGKRSRQLMDKVRSFDAVFIAGQARSHCVAWTIEDLLEDIRAEDPALAHKVYLLEDCMSSVVIPGVVDYTDAAEAAFEKFGEAGMHRVRSTDPLPERR